MISSKLEASDRIIPELFEHDHIPFSTICTGKTFSKQVETLKSLGLAKRCTIEASLPTENIFPQLVKIFKSFFAPDGGPFHMVQFDTIPTVTIDSKGDNVELLRMFENKEFYICKPGYTTSDEPSLNVDKSVLLASFAMTSFKRKFSRALTQHPADSKVGIFTICLANGAQLVAPIPDCPDETDADLHGCYPRDVHRRLLEDRAAMLPSDPLVDSDANWVTSQESESQAARAPTPPLRQTSRCRLVPSSEELAMGSTPAPDPKPLFLPGPNTDDEDDYLLNGTFSRPPDNHPDDDNLDGRSLFLNEGMLADRPHNPHIIEDNRLTTSASTSDDTSASSSSEDGSNDGLVPATGFEAQPSPSPKPSEHNYDEQPRPSTPVPPCYVPPPHPELLASAYQKTGNRGKKLAPHWLNIEGENVDEAANFLIQGLMSVEGNPEREVDQAWECRQTLPLPVTDHHPRGRIGEDNTGDGVMPSIVARALELTTNLDPSKDFEVDSHSCFQALGSYEEYVTLQLDDAWTDSSRTNCLYVLGVLCLISLVLCEQAPGALAPSLLLLGTKGVDAILEDD
ncbi:hypothetical protein DFP72DRAFT_858130 [Ephemerocybe angulata]|uniref:Uncharacterized protein n=1 Tax=Ephemerocybe angulata TaxID=980116 RepID=A0A8H6HD23_9AGAR|nr:hypothetical protein DFP72DRAFT_858130 [Tulosesus angulatus]